MGNVCEVKCDKDFYDIMEQKLMWMSYMAHKQLLFEKIKQKIEKEEGQRLQEIADLVVEASKDRVKSEKEIENKGEELRSKIKELFE